MFHELDLPVLRAFVKKKINLRMPHRVDAHAVFKTRRAAGNLRIRAGFRNCGNIFTKDQRILTKTKNLKFEIYFLTYKHLKRAFSRVPSLMVKTNFFLSF